jgi:hypothetical protein
VVRQGLVVSQVSAASQGSVASQGSSVRQAGPRPGPFLAGSTRSANINYLTHCSITVAL